MKEVHGVTVTGTVNSFSVMFEYVSTSLCNGRSRRCSRCPGVAVLDDSFLVSGWRRWSGSCDDTLHHCQGRVGQGEADLSNHIAQKSALSKWHKAVKFKDHHDRKTRKVRQGCGNEAMKG